MSNQKLCSHLTARGRPCRNRAALGTDPPACARHRQARLTADGRQPTAAQSVADEQHASVDDVPSAVGGQRSTVDNTRHFYFPHPTADERAALGDGGAAADLTPEVALVRVVLRRLLALLDAADDLPPEEMRRVAGLVFTGAHTVAALLGHRAVRPAEAQDWLNAALEEMAVKYPGLEV